MELFEAILWPPCSSSKGIYYVDKGTQRFALAGVAQWIDHWPMNQKIRAHACLG